MDQDLVFVIEDGTVIIHSIYGDLIKTMSLGQEAKDVKIRDAQIFRSTKNSTGVAVLTVTDRFFDKDACNRKSNHQNLGTIPQVDGFDDSSDDAKSEFSHLLGSLQVRSAIRLRGSWWTASIRTPAVCCYPCSVRVPSRVHESSRSALNLLEPKVPWTRRTPTDPASSPRRSIMVRIALMGPNSIHVLY